MLLPCDKSLRSRATRLIWTYFISLTFRTRDISHKCIKSVVYPCRRLGNASAKPILLGIFRLNYIGSYKNCNCFCNITPSMLTTTRSKSPNAHKYTRVLYTQQEGVRVLLAVAPRRNQTRRSVSAERCLSLFHSHIPSFCLSFLFDGSVQPFSLEYKGLFFAVNYLSRSKKATKFDFQQVQIDACLSISLTHPIVNRLPKECYFLLMTLFIRSVEEYKGCKRVVKQLSVC